MLQLSDVIFFHQLMQRHSIPGFPTIRKYHKGKVTFLVSLRFFSSCSSQMIEEYRGDRGVDSFIAFGMDRTQGKVQ
jgi:hypothetical protein